jgi:hypothetical protein
MWKATYFSWVSFVVSVTIVASVVIVVVVVVLEFSVVVSQCMRLPLLKRRLDELLLLNYMFLHCLPLNHLPLLKARVQPHGCRVIVCHHYKTHV